MPTKAFKFADKPQPVLSDFIGLGRSLSLSPNLSPGFEDGLSQSRLTPLPHAGQTSPSEGGRAYLVSWRRLLQPQRRVRREAVLLVLVEVDRRVADATDEDN